MALKIIFKKNLITKLLYLKKNCSVFRLQENIIKKKKSTMQDKIIFDRDRLLANHRYSSSIIFEYQSMTRGEERECDHNPATVEIRTRYDSDIFIFDYYPPSHSLQTDPRMSKFRVGIPRKKVRMRIRGE